MTDHASPALDGFDGTDLGVLFTAEDVAARFRVPRRTVYLWVDAGLLPATRVGPRLLRFSSDDLRLFLAVSESLP